MLYPNVGHKYRCRKLFGDEYSKDGLVKRLLQFSSQKLRTLNIYSDAVGDTRRSMSI